MQFTTIKDVFQESLQLSPTLNLFKNKKFVIQKSGKGISVVTVGKADYLDKMENLLSKTGIWKKINLKKFGILNFAFNQ